MKGTGLKWSWNKMLDVEKLTFTESLIIYQGLMALNYGNYTTEERNEIQRLKSEIRALVVNK